MIFFTVTKVAENQFKKIRDTAFLAESQLFGPGSQNKLYTKWLYLIDKSQFMKRGFVWLVVFLCFGACSQQDESGIKPDTDFTGNSVTYALQSGADWNLSGSVVFSEKKDGSTVIDIQFDNLETASEHPVHLHLGALNVDQADVAAWLNPIDGKTGKSKTNLKRLVDETSITFNDLKQLDACIKIHLSSSGDGQNIILAATNIGSAVTSNALSRSAIGVCKNN